MKITAIGVGNAFSSINFNQCFMLEENGKRMLVDCGQQILGALRYFSIDLKSIDAIYISHLHADHIGSLESFAFLRYDWINKPVNCKEVPEHKRSAPKLIGNENLLKELWDKSLRGGLESMEGFTASIETFFDTCPVKPNGNFEWQGWKFSLIQQIHIMTGSIISNTFGLLMEKEGHKTVYFTTDSQHCSPRQIEIFYRKADMIFQDCEVSPFPSGVHASYTQLAAHKDTNSIDIGADIRKKMYLSHYQDFVTEGIKPLSKFSNLEFFNTLNGERVTENSSIKFDWDEQAKKDGFWGFVKLGDVFEI